MKSSKSGNPSKLEIEVAKKVGEIKDTLGEDVRDLKKNVGVVLACKDEEIKQLKCRMLQI